jgi:hypothetical protein
VTVRHAVYYAPSPDDPLWAAGCAWLGRDPAGGAVGPAPPIEGLAAITADARGYGFHATLKPPMRVRDGVGRAEVVSALRALAAGVPPFPLPPLAVTDFHGFLCLRETRESAALQALCDLMVAGLDHLRAPLTEAELARRRQRPLSALEEANLRRWGYPDVFSLWFFHMTLTRRLRPEEMAVIRPVAESWFSDALAPPRVVGSVCLFEQVDAGPFRLTERVALGGGAEGLLPG